MNNKGLVYLTQTDTTVGFLSFDDKKLAQLKQRNPNQKILQTVDSFATLKLHTRIPNKFKNMIRRTQKVSFIYPNGESFRVVPSDLKHHNFISKVKKIFSTSANITGKNFDEDWSRNNCDVVIEDNFSEGNPSKIFKISNNKIRQLR